MNKTRIIFVLFFLMVSVLLISSCNGEEENISNKVTTERLVEDKSMICYSDIGGDSGIYAYEYGSDYIRVKFTSGAVYLYTYDSAGSNNIEQMKKLARAGDGLNSFINKNVKKLYEKKE